jgi:nucleoside phosphorylase
MNTLYLFPTREEAAELLTRRADLKPQVGFVGVGMAEAGANAAALIARHRPQRVVLCGIAGSCDRGLIKVGDVVQVIKDKVAGLPEKYSLYYTSPSLEGVDHYVNSVTVNRTGESLPAAASNIPCIEQMEGAAVAAACRAMGIEEYIHLRAISNYVDDARSAWRIKEAVKALGERIAELNL